MAWDPRPRNASERRGFELIGAMIKRRRQSLGWTQRALEARSGIDQTVISRLENGKQYGLRWSRFANLVDSLGGLDSSPGAPPAYPWPWLPGPQPEPAGNESRDPFDSGPTRRTGVIDLGAGLDARADDL
jgi:transcriptional regulator with XRE-family HTH domain